MCRDEDTGSECDVQRSESTRTFAEVLGCKKRNDAQRKQTCQCEPILLHHSETYRRRNSNRTKHVRIEGERVRAREREIERMGQKGEK